MRASLTFFALLATLLVASDLSAQFGAQGGGGGPGGGKGGFGGGKGGFGGGKGGFGGQTGGPGGGGANALQTFEFLAKGRPYILISDIRQTGLAIPLSAFAKEQGITNDQITRDQFLTFSTKMDQYRNQGGFGGGKGGFGGGPGGFGGPPGGFQGLTPPPGSPPIGPGQNPLDAIAQWAEADFRRRDLNGDGKLTPDEMSDQLRTQIDRWDTDRDGLISLDEYKVYYSARLQMRDGAPNAGPANPVTILIEEDYDRRPEVIRAGKLPRDLPKWFTDLDSEQTGQIALHQWFKAGKDIDEFKEWDRNDDGFVTVEEVLFKQRPAGGANSANGNRGPSQAFSGPMFGGPGFGGPGGGRSPGEWNGSLDAGADARGGKGFGKGGGRGGDASGNGGGMDFLKKKKG
jgi:hypothetical protein